MTCRLLRGRNGACVFVPNGSRSIRSALEEGAMRIATLCEQAWIRQGRLWCHASGLSIFLIRQSIKALKRKALLSWRERAACSLRSPGLCDRQVLLAPSLSL